MANASVNIEYGNLHPFDASAGDSTDWMHMAARGIIADMQDRPELASALDGMDDAARTEFVSAMMDIIQEAQTMDAGNTSSDSAPSAEKQ